MPEKTVTAPLFSPFPEANREPTAIVAEPIPVHVAGSGHGVAEVLAWTAAGEREDRAAVASGEDPDVAGGAGVGGESLGSADGPVRGAIPVDVADSSHRPAELVAFGAVGGEQQVLGRAPQPGQARQRSGRR